MSLIPPDLSSKLQDLSRLLRQSGDSAAQVNRLREQLVASGPNAPVAQRLDALYSRSIQLSWEEQNLASACVHNLESLLRSVNTTGKRGATGESGRAESGRAASLADGGAASAKAKRARVAESDVKIVRPPSPSSAEYPQSTDRDLEQLTGAAAEEPLCGAVALRVDAPLPVGARVVSRLSGPKVTPQHWAVGIVVRHIAAKAKYILKDEESSGSLKCARAHRAPDSRQLRRSRRFVAPTAVPPPSARHRAPQAAHDHIQVRGALAHLAPRAERAERAQRLPKGRVRPRHVSGFPPFCQGRRRRESGRPRRPQIVRGGLRGGRARRGCGHNHGRRAGLHRRAARLPARRGRKLTRCATTDDDVCVVWAHECLRCCGQLHLAPVCETST
jgi:hypothetical protein